jgi:hypothetical protein
VDRKEVVKKVPRTKKAKNDVTIKNKEEKPKLPELPTIPYIKDTFKPSLNDVEEQRQEHMLHAELENKESLGNEMKNLDDLKIGENELKAELELEKEEFLEEQFQKTGQQETSGILGVNFSNIL